MTVEVLVADLEAVGVRLWEESGQLRFRAPRGAMTEERRRALRDNRDGVLAHLRAEDTVVRPREDEWHDPFPLTDVQASYLLGRHSSFAYGGTGCHGYGELAYRDVDAAALETAWRKVIDRHHMLRAVIRPDGVQRVLPEVPEYHLAVTDLRGMTAEGQADQLAAARAELDHRVYEPSTWPMFELRVVRTDERDLLLFSIDFMICDFVSIQVLLAELHQYYKNPDAVLPPLEITFRDYLFAERSRRSGARYERDREYWLARADDLPAAPALPLADGHADAPPRFHRWATTLSAEEWSGLRRRAGERSVSTSGAVLAAYAEVVGRWSRNPRFTLDLTLLNRPPVHPRIDELVGDFTSVNPLEVDRDPAATFAERARSIQGRLWEDLDHSRYSGIEVIREISRRRGADAALLPVVFTSAIGLGSADRRDVDSDGDGALVGGTSQTPQVWIDCQNIERGGGLATNWDVRDGVFPDGLIDDMFAAYERLLRRLATSDDAWSSDSPVELPQVQVERRTRVNDTAGPVPDGLLHDEVVAQAARTPDRPAVIDGGVSVSYRDLLRRANAVANRLAESGAEPGELVGIVMDKGVEQVTAVLGALLAGCTYVPIDTTQPPARREVMLAGVRRALTQSWLLDPADWPDGLDLCAVDFLAPSDLSPSGRGGHPDELAYVIYTSGSTGTPKGVMISHRSARNTVDDINRRFGVSARDRVLGLANLGFDLSVYDVFGPLSSGGCLVLPDPEKRGDPSHWADLVATHEVTLWNSVPAQMRMLIDYLKVVPQLALPTLRLALLSGDWIPVTLPGEMRSRLPDTAQVSLGGATEAAIWSIWYPIGEVGADWRSIPYGTPLTNQTFHVLDGGMRPRPDLVPGELYIGGTGVARGYLGDAELTASRFVAHPETGELLYATGDLGRRLPDGTIEFLGREDFQVKIRGHRIELAEIEAELARHPSVGGAAVLVHGGPDAERRLVAFAEAARWEPGRSAEVEPRFREAALAAGDELLRDVDLDRYRQYTDGLDRVALLTMLEVFEDAGLFPDGDTGHTLDDVLAVAVPRYHRIVRRWLNALEQAGLVRRSSADGRYRIEVSDRRPRSAAEWQRVAVLRAEVGEDPALAEYFRASGRKLPSLLRGELDPVRLLFPDGRVDLSATLYGKALFNRWANQVAAAVIRSLAGDRPVRVLEVGAGTGSASAPVIEAVADLDVDYLFTDLSQFFLNEARERFAEHPWVRFGRYDLDRPYRGQGLRPNSVDIVFAADVLHATAGVEATLAAVRELLTAGGWLVFVEMTRDHYQIMTSLELMNRVDDAVGDFTDRRRGRDQTFLTREQWTTLLAEMGAEVHLCLPEEGVLADLGVAVFAARMKTDRAAVDLVELGDALSRRLPNHMVPAELQIVDDLPLSANGKVDRAALRSWLPDPVDTGPARGDDAEPAGELEKRIARQWCELLGVDQVGRGDDFFALGGDSLLAARLAGQLIERVPELSGMFFDHVLRLILEERTVAALAEQIGESAPETPVPEDEPDSPLTTLAEGDGVPAVVVPDAAGRHLPVPAFGTGTTVLGLSVADRTARLAQDPEVVLEHIAAEFTRSLREAGHDVVRLAGARTGVLLCLEVARQLVESGVEVQQLSLVAPDPPNCQVDDEILAEYLFAAELGVAAETWGAPAADAVAAAVREVLAETPGRVPVDRLRDFEGASDHPAVGAWFRKQGERRRTERMAELSAAVGDGGGADELVERCDLFWHLWSATAAHEPAWYAGDVTLLRPRVPPALWTEMTERDPEYWTGHCLGDVQECEVDGDAHDAALHTLFPGGLS